MCGTGFKPISAGGGVKAGSPPPRRDPPSHRVNGGFCRRFEVGPLLAVTDCVLKAFFSLAPAVVLTVGATTALASAQIQPGDALAQDELPPEAQRLEAALQGEPLGAAGDSVVERRRFDARPVQLGLGTGVGIPTALPGGVCRAHPVGPLHRRRGSRFGFLGASRRWLHSCAPDRLGRRRPKTVERLRPPSRLHGHAGW